MTKKFKFLFGTLVLALGFLFCFCFSFVSVNAEETVETETQEPKVEKTTPEVKEEETQETETIEVLDDSFLKQLQYFKWEDFEAVIGWVVAYLVVKFGTDAGVLIALLLVYLKRFKESTYYKNAVVKQNADANKKLEEKVNQFIDLLEELKKENAETLEQYKNKLEYLTNDKTKEIEADIEKVKAELK